MITQFLFTIIITIFGAITQFLPDVTTLPFGMDELLISSTGSIILHQQDSPCGHKDTFQGTVRE